MSYQAKWNGVVIAESKNTVAVEGNQYFPVSDIKSEYFKETSHTSRCPWKGLSNYYTVTVDGKENVNGAWFYKEPKPAAANIKGHVAFWNGIQVSKL